MAIHAESPPTPSTKGATTESNMSAASNHPLPHERTHSVSSNPVTPVIPLRTFKRHLGGFIRAAKAGNRVLIGSGTPEVQVVRASSHVGHGPDGIVIPPTLLVDLITTGAEAAASRVAEAQCAEGDINAPLTQGLGDAVADLLLTEAGTVWAALYVLSFSCALHKFECATALPHISLSALLSHLELRLEHDARVPSGRWPALQEHIFGDANINQC